MVESGDDWTNLSSPNSFGRYLVVAKKSKLADSEVKLDRRNTERRDEQRRQEDKPVAQERRTSDRRNKVARRRQIDPTTCERDYTDEEIEFMHALDEYKRQNGRMFPTCSEILEVIRDLGYIKPGATESAEFGPLPETTELGASGPIVSIAVDEASAEMAAQSVD